MKISDLNSVELKRQAIVDLTNLQALAGWQHILDWLNQTIREIEEFILDPSETMNDGKGNPISVTEEIINQYRYKLKILRNYRDLPQNLIKEIKGETDDIVTPFDFDPYS